jgi:hypothetical protein
MFFVTPFEGRAPILRAENIRELLLLCNELSFVGFLSQVTDFISGHSVAESEARQRLVRSRKETYIKAVSHPRNVSPPNRNQRHRRFGINLILWSKREPGTEISNENSRRCAQIGQLMGFGDGLTVWTGSGRACESFRAE